MGLGLPLARQVLAKHGGEISLRNESWHLGGGTDSGPQRIVSCWIVLPIHAEPLEVPEVEETDDDDGFEMF